MGKKLHSSDHALTRKLDLAIVAVCSAFSGARNDGQRWSEARSSLWTGVCGHTMSAWAFGLGVILQASNAFPHLARESSSSR